MKKRFIIAAVSVMLASASIIPAYAAEPMQWNIDPNTFNAKESDYPDWSSAESIAATKKWAEGYRGQLTSLTTDMEKFDAIAKIVCDFLSYDMEYRTLIDTYTYRDGKGVCEDYTRSVLALCQVAGVPCTFEIGYAYGYAHGWNKLTLDGATYYSDLTAYEGSGDLSLRLSPTLWSDHEPGVPVTEDDTCSISELNITTVANSCNKTYTDGGDIPDPGSDKVRMIGRSGKKVYVSKADADAFGNKTITADELIIKYPDLG